MATHLKILSQRDMKVFSFPPEFTGDERKRFFNLSKLTNELLESFRTPTNEVGFVLQLGYFKAVNKFFAAQRFHQRDIEFVARRLEFSLEEIDFEKYINTTFERHQDIILENLGFQKFNEQSKRLLTEEALSLCSNQMKPRFMFMSLVDFLRGERIEVPGYNTLCEVITNALRQFEKELLSSIEKHISSQEKYFLNELLEVNEEYLTEEKRDLKIKRYRITLLKKSSQSTKPARIRENINDMECLKTLFGNIEPVIKHLGLAPEIIRYYAHVLIKSQVFQIYRREENKYLLLIAFVIHQYYKLNDVLIDILMQATQTAINVSAREHKENFYEARQSRYQIINDISRVLNDHVSIFRRIEEVIHGQGFTDEEKIQTVKLLLSKKNRHEYSEIQEQLALLERESSRIIKDDDYYTTAESKSLKLQNRVSEIVKHLDFDKETSGKTIINAIEYYKRRDGILEANAPLDFLEIGEQDIMFDEKGNFRISLYKFLLFGKIASAIKSGALNLRHSYRYRAFDDYLIPQDVWDVRKVEFLERAGLKEFEDFQELESNLKQAINSQYRITNETINTGKNEHVKITPEGKLKVLTPKAENDTPDAIANLFPKNRFVPLFEVLSTTNKLSNYLDSFEHWQIKHNREKPEEKVFFAGIIGYGCNLGIRKIAKISNNIKQSELENTVNWYFSIDNLNRANDRVLEFVEQLQLPSLFKKEKDITHTSSDGQKFNISVDSLNANYSYKYFGKGKGVSVYAFIDESHRLFYSTVISSSEREAAYVIDGLMYNDVVQSNIHSTDTHGYSEMIFGVTHLLGISYAPRIKNFKEQRLYSFVKTSELKALNYAIMPDGRIDTKIIRENWDNILRFITTIKLKETTASQLFRRLSSYSRQHPLYRALKEFGKIIKTIFLLKYIDDVELRQTIEKQLNKLESSNKFAKAVFYGNNQEFQQATKEEQVITEGCKRLIQNAIVCWNYLYLSQLIYNAEIEAEKQNLIQTIRNGSVVTWQHINLQGEYDFSEEVLKDSIEFKLPELLELKLN